MGFGISKNDHEKDTEIQNLKAKITQLNTILQEKATCITLLRQELEAIRQLNGEDGPECEIVNAINKSHENRDYDYLVLSGGGVKGVSFAGVLEELENLGVIYSGKQMKLKGIAASSAGAIIGSLLAVGYTPHELVVLMKDLNFKKIFNDGTWLIKEVFEFIDDWGICPGNYIQELLGDLIKQKTGNPDYTLEDLYREKNFKFVTVTTDMCDEKSIYLYAGNPIKEYSNIPIRKAVRLTMGIPFAYEPVELNNCLFVDGGVLDNYPLHVFDGEFPGDPQARLNICPPNPKVLGIKIMTSDEKINYDIVPKEKITGIIEYIGAFINTFLTENDRRIMTPSFWMRSIIIVTPNYPLTTKTLTDEQKKELVDIGANTVKDFFATKSKGLKLKVKK